MDQSKRKFFGYLARKNNDESLTALQASTEHIICKDCGCDVYLGGPISADCSSCRVIVWGLQGHLQNGQETQADGTWKRTGGVHV
jgi:hypothetical protein